MSQYNEIVATPLTLWLAPVGAAFPAVDAAPSGSWVEVGTAGTLNEDEAGVTVSHNQTINKVRTGGSTGPVKAFRSEEDLMIKLTLLDITLEQLKLVLNSNSLTTVAAGTGTAGYKKLGLSRGQTVTEYALLARGTSPYDPAMTAQFQVPRCYQSASPALVYKKGTPVGVEMEFTALEDASAASADVRFGALLFQHAAAT